jgi:hypothetical protein
MALSKTAAGLTREQEEEKRQAILSTIENEQIRSIYATLPLEELEKLGDSNVQWLNANADKVIVAAPVILGGGTGPMVSIIAAAKESLAALHTAGYGARQAQAPAYKNKVIVDAHKAAAADLAKQIEATGKKVTELRTIIPVVSELGGKMVMVCQHWTAKQMNANDKTAALKKITDAMVDLQELESKVGPKLKGSIANIVSMIGQVNDLLGGGQLEPVDSIMGTLQTNKQNEAARQIQSNIKKLNAQYRHAADAATAEVETQQETTVEDAVNQFSLWYQQLLVSQNMLTAAVEETVDAWNEAEAGLDKAVKQLTQATK